MTRAIRAGAVLLAVLLVGLLTACGPEKTPVPGKILVIGIHANGPATRPDESLIAWANAAITQHQPLGVIGVEGTPRVLVPAQVVPIAAQADGAIANEVNGDVNTLVNLITTATPKSPGADLLTALLRAADAATASSPAVHDLLVTDNGLSDSASPLDFTRPGMTEADPKDVVTQLRRDGVIDQRSFAGLTVEFTGLGDTVAPQPPISEAQRRTVQAIYAAIIASGGGHAVIHTTPAETTRIRTSLQVAVVPVEKTFVDPSRGSSVPSALFGFAPGSSSIGDRTAASALLRPVAPGFARCPSTVLRITGYTSSAGNATRKQDLALSLARADAVRQLAITLGAAPACVRARGLGYAATPPDRKDGRLLPDKAAQNRRIQFDRVPR